MGKQGKQTLDVIKAMQDNGGYATLAKLNQTIDFSTWETKTPQASVRCILQRHPKEFFKIQPGLWALTQYKEKVMKQFDITNSSKSKENFSHTYYQGMIIDIGNIKNYNTYIPPQDKNKLYLDKKIGEISKIDTIPNFTYSKILERAKTIDVIWFNERGLPNSFYEVEHTTSIINSLNKFYELQDFRSNFYIVADKSRKREFDDKISQSIYIPIKKFVTFLDYESLSNQYTHLYEIVSKNNIII